MRWILCVLSLSLLAMPDEAQAARRFRVRTLCHTNASQVLPVVSDPTPVASSIASATVLHRSREVSTTVTECDGVTCRQKTVTVQRSTAQDRAQRLAALDPGSGLQQGHHAALGPVSGYEGLGYGSSPQEATQRCCFWGQRSPREIGTAQGSHGWYAVVLYD